MYLVVTGRGHILCYFVLLHMWCVLLVTASCAYLADVDISVYVVLQVWSFVFLLAIDSGHLLM